jgi:hypothetical protein
MSSVEKQERQRACKWETDGGKIEGKRQTSANCDEECTEESQQSVDGADTKESPIENKTKKIKRLRILILQFHIHLEESVLVAKGADGRYS